MVSKRTYHGIAYGTLCWCGAIVLAPLCTMLGGPFGFVGAVIYEFFHRICHQLDERSFHLVGEPLAVCIRCSSIYFSFLVGALLFPHVAERIPSLWSRRGILFYSILPMLIDVGLDVSGILHSTSLTKVVTGSMFGLVVPFYVIPAAQEGIGEFLKELGRQPRIIRGQLAAFRPFTSSGLKKGSFHA